MALEAYQQRVVDEKTELDAKIEKLNAFRGTEAFSKLDDTSRELMIEQFHAMDRYNHILAQRIEIFTAPKSEQ